MTDNVLSCIATYQRRRLAMWRFLINRGWMDPTEAGTFDEWRGMNPPEYEPSYYGWQPVRNYRRGLRITNGHRQFVLDSVRGYAVMRSIAEGLAISLVELVRSFREVIEHAEEIKALQDNIAMHFAMFKHGAPPKAEAPSRSNLRVGADGQICHQCPIRPPLPSYYFDPPHLEWASR